MSAKVGITRVIDGDTIEIEMTTRLRVRIKGVDTPERNEPGFQRATDFTRSWLRRQQGSLTLSKVGGKDAYGRLICDLNGKSGSLSSALLESGNAEVYRPPWDPRSKRFRRWRKRRRR